jgi:hypothetical protein
MPAFCTECGKKRKLNEERICTQCSKNVSAADAHSSTDTSEMTGMVEQEGFADSAFWDNMNKLLDAKFNNFEQTFKNAIIEEVKEITDPIAADLKSLKEENKKLKTEVTLLKAKEKDNGEKIEKIEKVVREQQKTLARNDKDARAKRLILAGVPDGKVTIDGVECEHDSEKIKVLMEAIDCGNIGIVNSFRIGKKDQGADERPRYILIEFSNAKDRNAVKKESAKLKDREDTKLFFFKADSTKQMREQYKRLYDAKKKIEEDDPHKDVKIEKGKLIVDEHVIDQICTDNDFL